MYGLSDIPSLHQTVPGTEVKGGDRRTGGVSGRRKSPTEGPSVLEDPNEWRKYLCQLGDLGVQVVGT